MLKAENFREEKKEIFGVPVKVMSYRIGERYYCHVASVEPGAVIVRAEAQTPQEAERLALKRARLRLERGASGRSR